MKKWEDIVKEKLDSLDGELPESVFEEFLALRGAAGQPSPATDALSSPAARRRFPIAWALASAAVIAGLAAIPFLLRPDVRPDSVSAVPEPGAPVAEIIVAEEPSPEFESEIPGSEPSPAGVVSGANTSAPATAAPPAESPAEPTAEASTEHTAETPSGHPAESPAAPAPEAKPLSPFIPQASSRQPVHIDMRFAAGTVAGCGLLASIAAAIDAGKSFGVGEVDSKPIDGVGGSDGPDPPVVTDPDPPVVSDPDTPAEAVPLEYKHLFPLRAGLSAGIPLAGKLRLTTGIEYSRYTSIVTAGQADARRQYADYLGVPLRLDYILVGPGLLEIYAGAGLEGDYCIGATLGLEKIPGDGPSFSLLGAGGVQLNFAGRAGLFLEPRLSWTIPSENRMLETYRTRTPLMFSVAAGLRFNICKLKQ